MLQKSESRLAEFEWGVACLLTALTILFVVTRMTHAGGLWRDEAGAVEMALMPSVHDIAKNFQHEAFPLLFPLTVRAYTALAGTSDMAFRVFGLLIGISLIAALWINARTFSVGVPLLSLALLGLNGAVIEWADSLRGYGMGIVLMLLTLALIWKVVVSPSVLVVSGAAIAAICSVQTLLYNAVMLFAIGIAGAAVALRNRHWNRALLVLGIGGVAAASLIPYVHSLQNAKEWNVIFTSPNFSFPYFWARMSETLSAAGRGIRWVWFGLVMAAAATGIALQFRPGPAVEAGRRDLGLYSLMILLVSIPAYFFFLKILGYPTQPWYYLTLLGLVAVSVDGALAAAPSRWRGEAGRLLLASGIAIWSFIPTWSATHVRQTNLDIIATKLAEVADPKDLIVVAPWHYGITFQRYYKGRTPWITVPPIDNHKFHRFDLLKEKMSAMSPIAPVLDAMANALRSGNRVWIVGHLSFFPPDKTPPTLAPAPYDAFGWAEYAYESSWSMHVRHLIQTRALTLEDVPLPGHQLIDWYENGELAVARGWKTP
jgi:hypothetical protein